MADSVNEIKNDINQLKTLINSWVPPGPDGGAALKGILSSWAVSSISPTIKTDLENEKVKHG